MKESISCRVPTIARFCRLYVSWQKFWQTYYIFTSVCWVFRFPAVSFKWIYQQIRILKRSFCVFIIDRTMKRNFLLAKISSIFSKILKLFEALCFLKIVLKFCQLLIKQGISGKCKFWDRRELYYWEIVLSMDKY